MSQWLLEVIEPAVLVQWLILLGLILYALETWRLRKSAQEQNEIMQKPCLVLLVRGREDIDINTDAVAGIPHPGERILDDQWSGTFHVALHNIGDGPAFNIEYEIQKEEQMTGSTGQGYLPYIRQGGKESVNQVTATLDSGDQEKEVGFKLSYESRIGRRYESEIRIQPGLRGELVVTRCNFQG